VSTSLSVPILKEVGNWRFHGTDLLESRNHRASFNNPAWERASRTGGLSRRAGRLQGFGIFGRTALHGMVLLLGSRMMSLV
jgi:hypothetical protein